MVDGKRVMTADPVSTTEETIVIINSVRDFQPTNSVPEIFPFTLGPYGASGSKGNRIHERPSP